MTELERLKALLDERGEPYVEQDFGITWRYTSDPHTATESMDGTLIVTGLTANQAIEATIGRESCKLVKHDDDWMKCDHCGLATPAAHGGWWFYCPGCGRRYE